MMWWIIVELLLWQMPDMCGEAPRLDCAKPNMDAWEEIRNKCP